MPRKKQVVRIFYRPRELAAAMGCSYRKVLTMIASNEIPAVTFPGDHSLFIPAAWVEQLTSQLMTDYEAFHANRASESASPSSASLGASDSQERAIDHLSGEQLSRGNDDD